ncbi:hypothetical protein LCGC14_0196140 [marine sediment metagenome]|uniref:Uncharacterized protein n=1 Tax=marine sediment metagenome TaxID=412755 RepID=A0A0F9X4N7_9ZZZZ
MTDIEVSRDTITIGDTKLVINAHKEIVIKFDDESKELLSRNGVAYLAQKLGEFLETGNFQN